MPTLDLIAFNELKDLMEDEFDDIVQLFIADSKTQVEHMQTAIDQDDLARTISTAHTLKSSSCNIGATDLAGLCEQVETQGRKNTLTDAAIHLTNIVDELSRVTAQLETHL